MRVGWRRHSLLWLLLRDVLSLAAAVAVGGGGGGGGGGVALVTHHGVRKGPTVVCGTIIGQTRGREAQGGMWQCRGQFPAADCAPWTVNLT